MLRAIVSLTVFFSLFGLSFAQPTAPPAYDNLNAVLWMQTAVEYKAGTVQAYRFAQNALLAGLRDPHWTAALEQNGEFGNLPPAVILDLDETVLDNSAYEARMTAAPSANANQAWTNWVEEKNAGLIPGAMDFLQFAHANGVTPIYVTNRVCDSSKEDDPTVEVLRKLQIPLESAPDRLFCAKTNKETDKTARRKLVAEKFRILLLIGDQLGDFLQIPANMTDIDGREKLFLAHQSLWGERWIQLPNPTYGSWVRAVGSTVDEKLKHLRQ